MTATTRTRSASALERCIEPVGEDRFLAEHWERRPLVVERDEPGRYDDLLTPADVERLLESGGLRTPAFRLVRSDRKLRASEYSKDIAWRPAGFTGMADVARAAAEFDGGATLVVQGLHHWWPPIADFCRSLETALGQPTQTNAYYTPSSAQGLPVHHDTHDVFCLQVSGEKRWLVYDPVWELPLKDQRYDASMGQPGAVVRDVTLHAGDTLYLPRGWMHEAMTSDTDSLHLTVGVNVHTWVDAFRAALTDCEREPEFRRSADVGGADELLGLLRARLTREQVDERRRRKLVSTRRPILAGQVDALRALRSLTVETELERRPTVLVELDGARLAFEGQTLSFPPHVVPDLAFIVAADAPFRAADLPGSLDDDGRLVLVRRLVRAGLLRPR